MDNKFKTDNGYCIVNESGFYFYSNDSYNKELKFDNKKTGNEYSQSTKHLGKISIFLSENCNLRCIYCYADSGKGVRTVSLTSAKTLIDFVSQKSDYFILDFHGGGEPLLFFFFFLDIYDYAHDTGKLLRVVLISNCYIQDRKTEILDWIVEHVDVFAISFDGIPLVQNFQRPAVINSTSSEIVEDSVRYLVKKNYNFTVRSTVTGFSDKYMFENIKYFHSLGIRNVIFSPCYNYGRSDDANLLPNPTIYVKQFMDCVSYAYKNNLTLRTTSFRMPGKSYCGALPAYNICLTVDDYISTCYEVTSKNDFASDLFFVGKIENGNVVFWKDKILNLKSFDLDGKCSKCECRFVCRGGCPVKQYRNSVRSSGNLCAITKLVVPKILTYLHENPNAANNLLHNSELVYEAFD